MSISTGSARRGAVLVLLSVLVLTGCDTYWAARVNVQPDGSPSPSPAQAIALTADGNTAVFSTPDDEVAPTEDARGWYRRDLGAGSTAPVFGAVFIPTGIEPYTPRFSADGRWMAVELRGWFIPEFPQFWRDLRKYDLTGATPMQTLASNGTNFYSYDLSDAGNHVVEQSPGVTAPGGVLPGLAVGETAGPAFTYSSNGALISYLAAGQLRSLNWITGTATIHTGAVPAGSTVERGMVAGRRSNVVGCEASTERLYVNAFGHADAPELASIDAAGSPLTVTGCEAFEISDDGRVLAFVSGGAVYVRDLERDLTRQVAPAVDPAQVTLGGLSADGGLVMFSTPAPGIVPSDADAKTDAFVVATFAPYIEELSQYVFAPGETASVAITGTGFQPDSIATITGPGVTNGATTYVSPNELHLDITVAPDATAGVRNVDVIIPGPGIDSQGRTATSHRCGWCVSIS